MEFASGLKAPTKPTLDKYGLTLVDWEAYAVRQNGLCAVCHRLPNSGRLHIDHEHVKGWKRLPPQERKRYVRGLCCYTCNRFRVGRMTLALARSVALYFETYHEQAAVQSS